QETERAHQAEIGAQIGPRTRARRQKVTLPLDIVIKATVLLATAGVVDTLVRRRGSGAARHLVWTMAIVGLLALPIFSLSLPEWTVRIPVARVVGPDSPTHTDLAMTIADPAPTHTDEAPSRTDDPLTGTRA